MRGSLLALLLGVVGPALGELLGVLTGLVVFASPAPAPVPAPEPAAELQPRVGPQAFVRASPPCPERRRACFGIHAHVVYVEGRPVASPDWLAAQLRHANRLFAAIDVGFTVAAADRVEARYERVQTRLERDEIGAQRPSPGMVPLFVVGQLDDVDVADTEIRGVHWRLRRDTEQRWVILSKIASSTVLAHELGHYFSLPHSGYGDSVMNKRPRASPAWEDRVFVAPEVERMRAARDRMVSEGTLKPR